MLRGLVGEVLEDLADLGVVIWLLGAPFTEERDKMEGDIRTFLFVLISSLLISSCVLIFHCYLFVFIIIIRTSAPSIYCNMFEVHLVTSLNRLSTSLSTHKHKTSQAQLTWAQKHTSKGQNKCKNVTQTSLNTTDSLSLMSHIFCSRTSQQHKAQHIMDCIPSTSASAGGTAL